DSYRLRQCAQRLLHQCGLRLDGIAPLLATPDLQRALDYQSAAIVTSTHESIARLRNFRRTVQLLGQHDRILDCHAGARRQLRTRRVRSVADEDDIAAMPGCRQKKCFERPEDDARCSVQVAATVAQRSAVTSRQ